MPGQVARAPRGALLWALAAVALAVPAAARACSVCGCGDPLLTSSDPAAIVGVVTRRDLLDPRADSAAPLAAAAARPALTIPADAPLREAIEVMVEADVGRLPVLDGAGRLAGILTRSDVLRAHRRRIAERVRPGPRRPGAPAPAA